jgi:TPR repeat protein
LCKSGTIEKCPFCTSDHGGKTDKEGVEEMMKRVEANDAGSMSFLGSYYHLGGKGGFQQDSAKAMELWKQAAELGSSVSHFYLGNEYYASSGAHCKLGGVYYRQEGDMKKAKFHFGAAGMAGHEDARFNIGTMEHNSGNPKRALKHWMIAASAGEYRSMHQLLVAFKQGLVSTDAIDATLTAYNNSCAEMRSEARDAAILYTRTRSR